MRRRVLIAVTVAGLLGVGAPAALAASGPPSPTGGGRSTACAAIDMAHGASQASGQNNSGLENAESHLGCNESNGG